MRLDFGGQQYFETRQIFNEAYIFYKNAVYVENLKGVRLEYNMKGKLSGLWLSCILWIVCCPLNTFSVIKIYIIYFRICVNLSLIIELLAWESSIAVKELLPVFRARARQGLSWFQPIWPINLPISKWFFLMMDLAIWELTWVIWGPPFPRSLSNYQIS